MSGYQDRRQLTERMALCESDRQTKLAHNVTWKQPPHHGLLLRLPDLLKFGPCRRCYLLRLALLLLPHACRRCCLLLLLQHGLGLPSLLHQLRM